MVKLLKFLTRHGIFYTCHNDAIFVDHLMNGKVFEEEIILSAIVPLLTNYNDQQPKVILDIGGHIGSHSILYSKYIPNITVHTFEPQKVLYDILNINIKANNITNIVTHHSAVGYKNGCCTMSAMLYDGYNEEVSYETDKLFNYGGISIGVGGETVSVINIDSLQLERCDFIKIDVEGAEPFVLMGGLETIRRCKPYIMLECNCKGVTEEMKEGFGILPETVVEPSLSILEREGYAFKRINADNVIAIPVFR
jgi:FkbM family methyltransferase